MNPEKRTRKIEEITSPQNKGKSNDIIRRHIEDTTTVKEISKQAEIARNDIKASLDTNKDMRKLEILKQLSLNYNYEITKSINQLKDDKKYNFQESFRIISENLKDAETRASFLKGTPIVSGFVRTIRLQGYKEYVNNLIELKKLQIAIEYNIVDNRTLNMQRINTHYRDNSDLGPLDPFA
jgi:hypothetical protein